MNATTVRTGLVVAMLGIALSGCTGFQTPPPAVHPADARVEAMEELEKASQSTNAFTRAHAIEAMAATLGAQAGPAYVRGLCDAEPAVRYAAAVAVGDLKYAPAKDRLLAMAGDKTVEPDRRVMPGVIYAMYELGVEEYAGQLGGLLFDTEQEVRANAAMAMGRMGEPSATGPLRSLQAQETEDRVRLSIFEALAMLGDEASAYRLEAYARTTFLDMRLAAITAMSQFPSPRSLAVMRQLISEKRNPPQVRVAAGGALAKMGEVDEDAQELAIQASRSARSMLQKAYGSTKEVTDPEAYQLQQLSAIALGYMDRPDSLGALHQLMASPDPDVRVAAAMSTLRLVPASAMAPPAAQSIEMIPPAAPAAAADQPAAPPAMVAPEAAQPAGEQAPAVEAIAPDPTPKLQTSGAKE